MKKKDEFFAQATGFEPHALGFVGQTPFHCTMLIVLKKLCCFYNITTMSS